ncbi:hypothetical protein U1Q18_001875 [Sarracenia purpurea var. burkii]
MGGSTGLVGVHGSVCLASVVVTQTLDWKLHAFDVLSEFDGNNEASAGPMLQYEWLVGSQYKPMELLKSDWATIRKSPPWAIDSWGLGKCITAVSTSRLSVAFESHAFLQARTSNISIATAVSPSGDDVAGADLCFVLLLVSDYCLVLVMAPSCKAATTGVGLCTSAGGPNGAGVGHCVAVKAAASAGEGLRIAAASAGEGILCKSHSSSESIYWLLRPIKVLITDQMEA